VGSAYPCQHRGVSQAHRSPRGPGRFLLATIDGGGTVPPALGLASTLVRRGHQVCVLSDPIVASAAESAGCSFTPWREAPHFSSREQQTTVIAAFESRNPFRAISAVRTFWPPGTSRRYARDVISAAREGGADAVLAESAVPGILIGALSTRLPTAALVPNVYMRPTTGFPLLGTGWSPGRTLLGQVRDRLAPKGARWLLDRTLPGLNAVLADYGEPPLTEMFELLDRCHKVLVMTSPSFDFTVPQLPDNVCYVGPHIDDPDWAVQSPWRRSGSEPLVLVATSSIYQHQVLDLLRRAVQALGSLPIRGVVTTGRGIEPADLPAPSNVEVLQTAPHGQIMAEASVVVTHAGHGTVLKALAAGAPLVCIPMGRDQKDNATRVLRLGAGVQVSKRSSPARIAAAVDQILTDPSYGSAARRFADELRFQAANRPSAADEAETLLGPG
jgi:MGT family glycosyltransferase